MATRDSLGGQFGGHRAAILARTPATTYRARGAVVLAHPTLRPVGRGLKRVNTAGVALLSGRWGPAVVLVSGAVGIPPLLAIAFHAGTSTMRMRAFVVTCLGGRAIRFGVLALVPDLF